MTEATLQALCVRWFRYQFPQYERLLFAVPNGGSRNVLEASNLKKQGVLAGVSDLIFLKSSGSFSSLCIEMKVGKNGQTTHQKDFQKAVEQEGGKYIICRSLEEFIREIREFLGDKEE